MEPIQIIIISNDELYKKNLKNNLKKYNSNVDIILLQYIGDILPFLDETPPFKLLVLKPDKPITKEKIVSYRTIKKRKFHLRLLIFQQEHKSLVAIANVSTIYYLKNHISFFANMNTE